MVTHPSTNRVRRRVTSLIRPTSLPTAPNRHNKPPLLFQIYVTAGPLSLPPALHTLDLSQNIFKRALKTHPFLITQCHLTHEYTYLLTQNCMEDNKQQTSHIAESCWPSRRESSQLCRLSMKSSYDCLFSIMCCLRASRSRAAASRRSSFNNADESCDPNSLCRREP